MKKLFTLMLCITVLVSSTAFAAKAYLIDLGSGSTWTTGGPASGFTVVNVSLSNANAGAAVSFNAWFADRTTATPTYGGGTTFATGDEVWIVKGTYYLTGTITLKAGVAIYGGFIGTETTTAGRAKTTTDKWDFSNPTVLDGSVAGTKTYTGLNGASTSTSTIIDGLIIQNCTYNSAAANIGAAATFAGTGYTMQNCIVTACTVTGSTGGYCTAGIVMNSGSTLKDSYLHHNTSTASNGTSGGTIALRAANGKLTGCTISNNSTTKNSTVYVAGVASGVEISNCSFSSNSGAQGGAISTYLNNVATTSAMTISNCSFTSNTTIGSGGALALSYQGTIPANNIFNISNCTFTSNSSSATGGDSNKGGGAVWLSTCIANIDNCTFISNSTTLAYGGAILIPVSSSCTISNSKYIKNTAGTTTSTQGSAIYSKSNYTANNCLFADNTGSSVIHFFNSALASTFQNCTFANNMTTAPAAAPIALLALTPKYAFSNCLFYQLSTFSTQTPTMTNCAFDIAVPGAATNSFTGITAADFVDATNATKANRDYRLSATSLAIDAGTNLSAAASPITKDILDVNRPQGGAFDIGAYESSAARISGTKIISELTLTPSSNITVSSGELTVDQTTELNSIIVAPGAKLTHSSGTLTVNNGITLESDASGTATLMDSYSEPTINATVKQYVTAGRNWYMSMPINNTANASVLDKGASVQEYNEGSGLWQLATGTLTRGKGYVQVASAGQGTTGTVSFNGTTNSGNVEIALTNNTGGGKGFNLVGNPYPSYLSWSAVAADNAAANMSTRTMWYRTISYNSKSAWTPNSTYSLNDIVYNSTRFYKVVTAGTSAASGGPTGGGTGISDGSIVWNYEGSIYIFATISASGVASPATVSNLVPPMQAFWVKSTGGTLTFKNTMRSHNTDGANILKAPKSASNDIQLIRLNVTNGASADEVVIYANADATNAFDQYDAPKYFNAAGSNQPEIYTQVGNEKLVVNAMNELNQGTEIPLGFATEKGNTFTISASELKNFGSDMQIVLKDIQKNTEFNLTSGQAYAFSSDVVNDAIRFSVIFRVSGTTTGLNDNEKLNAQVFVNAANQITIVAPEKTAYAIYNAMGQLIENGQTTAKLQTVNYKLQTGVYIVNVANQSSRVIIK